jgi:hypothetical protein
MNIFFFFFFYLSRGDKKMLETKDRECGALNHQLLEAEFRISSLDSLLETKSNEFIRLQTEVEGFYNINNYT